MPEEAHDRRVGTSRPGGALRWQGVGPEPFERIVDAHGATVWRVCRALLGPIDADDAWSATFLSALAAWPRLRPGSDVGAWLVTIAHRKAIDVHRDRARHAVSVGSVPDRPVAVGPQDAHAALGFAGRAPELWEAVSTLPDRQRSAVALHHVAGLPYVEVGEVLGCSDAAARRAAADGIAALRRRFPSRTDLDGGGP